MTMKRKIIEIDEELCNGCGQCVSACAEGAIQIIEGKAALVSETYCDGLGACLGECPQGALRIIEREAQAFDDKMVEEHLKSPRKPEPSLETSLPCGCPSTRMERFERPAAAAATSVPSAGTSQLSHWPVQIRLVPPTAPFLKGADLLVAADCTPVAYADFHREFLSGKTVLIGCPKFDDKQAYVQRFADIFRTANIRSVTVVVMEVPCCQGLPAIVRMGMELAGKSLPLDQVVISSRGTILRREKLVA